MEEVQQGMRAQPGLMMNDPSKFFYCVEESQFLDGIIVGDLDNSPTGDGALRILDVMRHASHRQAAASGMTVEDPDLCMHGTTKEAYSSFYQEMLDNFLQDFDEGMNELRHRGPGPGPTLPSYEDAMGVMMKCITDQRQKSIRGGKWSLVAHHTAEIACHAFAACARKILSGGDEGFDDAHNGLLFALYFHYIEGIGHNEDELAYANERFNVYAGRLRNDRRSVLRVLAKHLPCDCAKKAKITALPLGREVKRCDCCEELFLATRIKQCAKCNMVSYCGRACQIKDWNEGDHKHQCKVMRSSSS